MSRISSLLTTLWLLSPLVARAIAPLETETARFDPRGTFQAEAVFEHQTSQDGRESALPLAFEYAFTGRLSLIAEPVPYTRISPSQGPGAKGPGDIEVTLEGLMLAESGARPALALAGEVKIPTAEAPLVGSDEFDYTVYAIASKRFGALDTHLNAGYTFVGKPPGVTVNNTFDYALAGEYTLAMRWQAVAEVVGNTSALAEASNAESATTPEITNAEVTGMLGARYVIAHGVFASMGVTVDNNGAVLVRPGFTMKF